MRRIPILSIIVVLAISVLCCGAFGESSKYPVRSRRNAFILRKCIATAELHRRTGPHGLQDPIAKEESEEARKENLSPSMRENGNTGNNWQRITYKARKDEAKEEKLVLMKNTPLTTVDIKTLRNQLPAFKKKSLLPELQRSVSSRAVGPSQNIIMIKSLN